MVNKRAARSRCRSSALRSAGVRPQPAAAPANAAAPAGIPEDLGELVRSQVTAALHRADTLDLVVQAITDSVSAAVLAKIQTTIQHNANKVSELEKSLAAANEKILSLENQLIDRSDEIEQVQRRNNLRVFGVPEEPAESTTEVFLKIAREKLGVNVSESDLDSSHRVGRKLPDAKKPRPILIKLMSYRKRSEIFGAKKKLAKSGITIREDLTAERMKVLNSAVSDFGLHNVWTRDGRIMIKTTTGKHSVCNDKELRSLSCASQK